MVYLLEMVIFHGYVSHNQMVIIPATPSNSSIPGVKRTSSQVRDSGTRWAAPRKGHGNWRRRLFQQRRGWSAKKGMPWSKEKTGGKMMEISWRMEDGWTYDWKWGIWWEYGVLFSAFSPAKLQQSMNSRAQGDGLFLSGFSLNKNWKVNEFEMTHLAWNLYSSGDFSKCFHMFSLVVRRVF